MVERPHPLAFSRAGRKGRAMAFKKNGNDEKTKGKAPDWVVRAKQSPDSDFYVNCGAAWNIEVNGKDAISLKLTAMPVVTDGSFLLLAPKED
jgi:hypothetical protein